MTVQISIHSEEKNVEIRQLEYFVAVAERLNFSRAAEQLYVSQPLLSQQIADLEEQLGVTLLVRNRRSVKLTNAGIALLREAKFILERVNGTRKIVQDAANGIGLGGTLRVGYEQVVDRSLIAHTSFRFKQAFPEVDVALSVRNSASLAYMLSEGELDLGFTLQPDEKLSPQFDRLVVALDRLSLFVATPLATDHFDMEYLKRMVREYQIYALDRDSKGINSIIHVLSTVSVTPQFIFLESIDDIIVAVEAGTGIGFLPYRRIKECLQLGSITAYPLSEMDYSEIGITVIWNKNNSNPLIRNFISNIAADE